MKPEIKKIWVDALRSGKYEQGQTYLKNVEGKYCCLGVLAEVAEFEKTSLVSNVAVPHFDDMAAVGIVGCLGKLQKPLVYANTACEFLTDLNDNGMPFSEIADVIEEQF